MMWGGNGQTSGEDPVQVCVPIQFRVCLDQAALQLQGVSGAAV